MIPLQLLFLQSSLLYLSVFWHLYPAPSLRNLLLSNPAIVRQPLVLPLPHNVLVRRHLQGMVVPRAIRIP